jgi:phage shock protein C
MDRTKRLYRSRTNRFLGGVCGGLGEYLNMDPTLVRLMFVLVGIVGYVVPAVVIYVVMMIVVPEEPGTLTGPTGTAGAGTTAAGGTTPAEPAAPAAPFAPAGPFAPAAPAGPAEPKITSGGEEVPTGAGGRSLEPAPEPLAGEETVHGPVGQPGEEVYRQPEDLTPPPAEERGE